MKNKYIDTGFGVKIRKIKVKSTVSDLQLNDYEIRNMLKKKKGGKK